MIRGLRVSDPLVTNAILGQLRQATTASFARDRHDWVAHADARTCVADWRGLLHLRLAEAVTR